MLLTKYHSGDQIEKNEMGGTSSTFGGKGLYSVVVGRREGKRPFVRPRRRWENNIKLGLQNVGRGRGLN